MLRTVIRHPVLADAKEMYAIVTEGTLDKNSPYAYLMFAQWFDKECMVAMHPDTDRMLGFMMGFRFPRKQDTYFVWQVGVRAEARGQNIAGRILHEVVAANGVDYVQATVTPSNAASRTFFTKFAESVRAPIRWEPCFQRQDFPPTSSHDPEDLLIIGPIAPLTPRAE